MKFPERWLLSLCLLFCLLFGISLCFAQQPAANQATAPTDTPTSDPRLADFDARAVQAIGKARDLFSDALQREDEQRREQLRAAYQRLQQAAVVDPRVPPARTMWAKMLISAGDRVAARRALQQAVLEAPNDPEAWLLLANMAATAGQLAEAELAYAKAEELLQALPDDHPRGADLQAQAAAGRGTIAQARAILASESGETQLAARLKQLAVQHLQRFASLDADNADAHKRLADALLKNGQTDQAIAAYDQARQLDPSLPPTALRLARAHVRGGDHETARQYLQQAVERHGDDVDVRIATADMVMVMGDLEAARRQLDQAQQLVDRTAETNEPKAAALEIGRLQAQLLRFDGQWQAAADRLQELSNQYPADSETAMLLALTLSELDSPQRQRAKSIATVTAQRFGSEGRSAQARRALLSLAWTAHAAGDAPLAQSTLRRLLNRGLQSNQISGDEAYFLARLLVEYDRPELAAALLAEALDGVNAFPKRAAAEQLAQQLK